MKVWFWQLIISPHMANLASELADLGVEVCYIAHEEMSADRKAQGWGAPSLGSASLKLVPSEMSAIALANSAPHDVVHICQGIRGNGVISAVQSALRKLDRKQIVVMETVDDQGLLGYPKRHVYARLFKASGAGLLGVLATGLNTADWVVGRGVSREKVFPFAYFLQPPISAKTSVDTQSGRFRFIFVGQFIQRKRLDLLIDTLGALSESHDFELVVVGSGPLEQKLRQRAEFQLPGRFNWVGSLSMEEVREELKISDCLVLPSRHDGWGAVVSEALMSGTPAIASDSCGAAVVVKASGVGGVFSSRSSEELHSLLKNCLTAGKIESHQRLVISKWASCLTGKSGAIYLIEIIRTIQGDLPIPNVPWQRFQ